MIAALVTRWLWPAVAVVLLAALIFVGFKWWGASSDLEDAISDRNTAIELAGEYKRQIEDQNNQILQWQGAAQSAQEQSKAVIAALTPQLKRVNDSITALKNAKGQTCSDAIPYVRQALSRQ